LEQASDQIVAALALRPEVRRAVLFGCFAEDRRDLLTDLDILVIADSPPDCVPRTSEMYQFLHVPADMSLPLYTPEESAKNQDRVLVQLALHKGRIILEKGTT
jgi:hypothetical protein